MVQLFEAVTRMGDFPWLITHEMNIFFDVLYELNVLLCWIRVIETQITVTIGHLGLHEVESHSFTMTNV